MAADKQLNPTKLPAISIREFAGRFADGVKVSQQPFTWFLGAGCSRSSGISAAGGLVDKWLRELFDLQGNSGSNFDAWRKDNFPTFDAENPALSYAPVFARRHPSPVERQREIEMICSLGEPAYGYATLAQLLSSREYGRSCNTVLTTNFDDLIADALYLYGERNARPLVVTHEALARYVRTNSPRPTVVKLHGDAHLDPKNLQPETREIDTGLAKQLYPFLQDHALIFVGYGGNDESILKFVRDCPLPALAPPIYWVSKQEPPSPFAEWLHARNARRVDHTDFDQLMHLIRGALNIELLDRNRWTQIGDTYYEAFEKLREEVDNVKASTADTLALQAASSEIAKSLPDDWSYYEKTREKVSRTDRKEMFVEGLKNFPDSFILNANFAILLKEMGLYDEAEHHYKKAISINSNRPTTLTNYARFLRDARNDLDGAEELYKKATSGSPANPYSLRSYATFLADERGKLTEAELLFKRAIELDGANIGVLTSYGDFLADHRDDVDAAEQLFLKAVEIDPKDAGAHYSVALFYEQNRADFDKAEAHYRTAIELDPFHSALLGAYADFLETCRSNYDEAERFYKRALDANPNNRRALRNFSKFLKEIRKDETSAATYRMKLKAIEGPTSSEKDPRGKRPNN
ncbi:SIR2 family protein [Bradyrhizobium symbiodeficiens]|uniref:SIR2 family protein n=1 Tax=Bradyrhizobium symbiodeficiens TaxID=1404367 RepID=UPI0030CED854